MSPSGGALAGINGRHRRHNRLWQIAKRLQPRRILEIGVLGGESAARMIGGAAGGHRAGPVQYFGFDLFEDLVDPTLAELGHAQLTAGDPDCVRLQEDLRLAIARRPRLRLDQVARRLAPLGASLRLFKGDSRTTLPAIRRRFPRWISCTSTAGSARTLW